MFGAYEFVFNNIISSRYNLVLLYSDAETGITTSTGTPEKNYATIGNPRSGRKTILGVTTDEPLSFPIEILVSNFDELDNPIPLKRNLVGQVRQWLFNSMDYGVLRILQPGMEELYFRAVFNNVEDINYNGDIIGFKANVICDNTGAYKKSKYEFNVTDISKPNVFCENCNVYTVKPVWTVIPKNDGEFVTISNGTEQMAIDFQSADPVIVDCENLTVESQSGFDDYYNIGFNFVFPELKSGMNQLAITGNAKVICEFENVIDVGG